MDKYDISFEIRDLKKEMPLLTDVSAKIPRNYEMGFPKNLEKYTTVLDNKVLNKHVAIIEEIAHKYPTHILPKWMQHYQNRYFKANLAHDGFFKLATNIDSKTKFRQHNDAFISFGKLIGSQFETTTGSNLENGLANLIWCSSVSGATVNGYYNELAVSCQNSTGNVRIADYDSDGGSAFPSTLLASFGGFALDSAYTIKSVTEYQTVRTAQWLAILTDNASANFNGSTGGTVRYVSRTYASDFTNPVVTTNADSAIIRMKALHS